MIDETAFSEWVNWIIQSEDRTAYRSIDSAYRATSRPYRPAEVTVDAERMVEHHPDGSVVLISWYEKRRLVLATAAEQKAFNEYLERRFTRSFGTGSDAWESWFQREHDISRRYHEGMWD